MKLTRKTAEEIAKIQRDTIDTADDVGESMRSYLIGKAHALKELLLSCDGLYVTVDSWGKCFID